MVSAAEAEAGTNYRDALLGLIVEIRRRFKRLLVSGLEEFEECWHEGCYRVGNPKPLLMKPIASILHFSPLRGLPLVLSRVGQLIRSHFAMSLVALSPLVVAQSLDSDGDGIPDSIEGESDYDGDGKANRYDLDSDDDGLSDSWETAGDADGDSVPNYLDLDSDADGLSDRIEGGFDTFEKRVVDAELLSSVETALPESRNVSASFLNPVYTTNLTLGQEAQVSVTFLDEGAGYRNSLGYYVYPSGAFDSMSKGDVDTDGSGIVSVAELDAVSGVEVGWVFPNASAAGKGGSLLAGDTVALGNDRRFSPGTTVGFFLVQNAWQWGSIKAPNAEGTSPQVMFSTDFLNPEAPASAEIGIDSAAGKLRHVALLFADQERSEIIMGFEDLNRTSPGLNHWGIRSDEDFNDAIFTIQSTPISAFKTAGIPTVSQDGAQDTDGDGILDVDELPGDSDGDGQPNYQDPDDDGDGIVTPSEGVEDTDADGLSNYLDTDSDGDGLSDQEEGGRDTDLDGRADFLDTDSDNDGVSDSEEANLDTDGDGLPNRIDSDDDGDGIPTVSEGVGDFDEDGRFDYLDLDSDGDTIPDEIEGELDSDEDGVLNRYDLDDDNDGLLSQDEGYADPDGDGLGNHVDADSDNDSVVDRDERAGDSDGDGLLDFIDDDDDGDGIPTSREEMDDGDGDGLSDYLDTDSDGDGLTDDLDYISLVARTKAIQEDYAGYPLEANDHIRYTIQIENEGIEVANDVMLTGIVPLNTLYVSDSLKVNEISVSRLIDSESILELGQMAGGSQVEIVLEVAVPEGLSADVRKIESQVAVSYVESTRLVYSDNDPSGHCGIVDDGLDRDEDLGDLTDDDDPCVLPLLQGTFAEHCNLAFEDLQNAGWCDWDMNDLVLDVSSFYLLNANGEVEALSVRYQALARGAGMDSELMLSLPFAGAGAWQSLYLDADGSIEKMATGDGKEFVTVQVWDSSMDALPPFTGLKYQWGASRTERFDPSAPGKIAVVNFYFDEPLSNPLAAFPSSPFDTWIRVEGTGEEIHQLEYSVASTQIVYEGPLFGRSLPFVVKFESGFLWPAEGQAIWDSHPEYVGHVKSGWTEYLNWGSSFDLWRVWFDDQARMPGVDEPNPVAESEKYKNYVDTHSKP